MVPGANPIAWLGAIFSASAEQRTHGGFARILALNFSLYIHDIRLPVASAAFLTIFHQFCWAAFLLQAK